MQLSLHTLEKKAVAAALDSDWKLAIELNETILEKIPDSKKAKIRLGRAYLMSKKYAKAKKIYNEILELDPINKIALKNLKLASEKKGLDANKTDADFAKDFIQEPGTTSQVKIDVDKKLAKSLKIGQELNLKINKTKLGFMLPKKSKPIAEISDETSNTVYTAKQQGKDITSKVLTVGEEGVTASLVCEYPIFKSQVQQEKPFVKKGAIVEPKVDVSGTEDRDK